MLISQFVRSILFIKKFKPIEISKNIFCTLSGRDTQNYDLICAFEKKSNALQNVSEDLSSITPYFPNSFNIAAYVNNSETLQNLVNLNVNLSKIEKKPYVVEKILKLDFDRDIKKHILFIKDYIDMNSIGEFITKNPLFLCESLDDMEVRVNYLHSKSFTEDQIKRIISKNPFWLMFSTVRIDRRLGHFQKEFNLSGEETRFLATKQPKIITYNLHHIKTNLFVIKEEMGFNDNEVKQLVLNKPRLWMLNQKSLLERFNYIHNVVRIPQASILQNPELLLTRCFKIKQRHSYLEKLNRAQYNPKKENYIPVKALAVGTDVEFCEKYTKSSISNFNIYLKTL